MRLVKINERGARIGESHQAAKVSDADVDLIRAMHEEDGLSYRDLAQAFGLSKSCIAHICQYRKRAQTPVGIKEVCV